MSTGSTSISGVRASGNTRRDIGSESRRFSMGWTVHIVLILLAVLLWWIARDMVSFTKTLNDTGRVRYELSESLKGEWRVISQSVVPISLEVNGPTKEINDFASQLDENPGRFVYVYEITASDIANLPVDKKQQVTITADVRNFKESGESVVPAELSVRPQGGDRVFQVKLERFIRRPAMVNLAESKKGQVQVTVARPGGGQDVQVYSYIAEVKLDRQLEVFGPASAINAVTNQDNLAQLRVSVDAKQVLDNKSKAEDRPIEDILKEGYVVSSLQLLPIEDVEIRDADKQIGVAQVPVEISFSRMQNYVPVSAEFDVNVVLPNWLAQKGARVENLPAKVQVDMEILGNQRDQFSPNNLSVLLDLSGLDRNEVSIETVEDSPLRRIRVLNTYYSLKINTERLTYQFSNPVVTADQYLPIGEISIVWTE